MFFATDCRFPIDLLQEGGKDFIFNDLIIDQVKNTTSYLSKATEKLPEERKSTVGLK